MEGLFVNANGEVVKGILDDGDHAANACIVNSIGMECFSLEGKTATPFRRFPWEEKVMSDSWSVE